MRKRLKRLKIALLIESSRAYARDMLCGIADYARMHGPWSFYHHEWALRGAPLSRLREWGAQGILIQTHTPQLVRQVRHLNLPTVNANGLLEPDGIPTIKIDHQAVVRLAIGHLLERGFEHFAYCGFAGVGYYEQRRELFVEYLGRAGYETSVHEGPRRPREVGVFANEARHLLHAEAVAAWIRPLPKPLGLMACNDIRAQQVINACGEFGIAVPDEVAVVGVGNDEVQCELCNPPLSSIDLNTWKCGYEAAALLDRIINGLCLPTEPTLVEPAGVVTRQSTDVTAIADHDVATAVHFIREHACDGIRVEDVLEHVQVSRSTLERRFARLVGRLPKAEIIRVQLQRMRQFLTNTDYPLEKIAQLAGFTHVENMCTLFKKKTGQTPGQYRKESQSQGPLDASGEDLDSIAVHGDRERPLSARTTRRKWRGP